MEQKIENIDVRKDLDLFIEHEKSQVPNRTTSLHVCDNDDGGVASTLAILNSFSEGIGVGVGVWWVLLVWQNFLHSLVGMKMKRERLLIEMIWRKLYIFYSKVNIIQMKYLNTTKWLT